jgi:Mrp family chromosome partitioning ATPase
MVRAAATDMAAAGMAASGVPRRGRMGGPGCPLRCRVVLDRRLLIVTGKGGVGRSAVSAALAIRAAREGRRVLAIGMTDGAGVAAHFGVRRLTYEPTEMRPGVHALVVDRATALDEYLRLQMPVPKMAPTGGLARGLSLFVDTVPGIREVVTIGKVLFEVTRGPWDLVVADAPPTGQIASYLGAPRTIAELVPAGRVREQVAWMRSLLADQATSGLVIVTLAEELPVAETIQALDELAAEPVMDVAAIADLGGVEPASIPPGPHRDAAALHDGLYSAQQTWLGYLPPGPRLPYLFGMLTPGEVAARLDDAWKPT